MVSAAILIIGNEVLSGKVEEENAKYMIRGLRKAGVDLKRVSIVRDDIDVIAAEVEIMSGEHDVVFTSGGVGGTHDDVTIKAVSKALGVALVQNQEILKMFTKRYGKDLNNAHLRMTMLPEGAQLVGQGKLKFPSVQVQNIHIFPGVPKFLKSKFDFVVSTLDGIPIEMRTILLSVAEDKVAGILESVAIAIPEVEIGSYPRFDIDDFRVKVTLESRETEQLEKAYNMVTSQLDPSWIVQQ
ncbi:MAG: competence/damage-inducible protein A [Myxococcota bacterium]|nr:competence/damage-inducible protein A [Myxococcota bacterium]